MNEKPIESVRDVIANVWGYLPALLAGLAVLVLGLIAAWVVAKVLVRVLIMLRLDRVLARSGWGRGLEKGDVRHSVFAAAGTVAGALVFLVFLDNAVAIWRLTVLSRLLENLVLLVPNVIIAALVLAAGWAAAAAVSGIVRRTLEQEEVPRARLAARLVSAAILVTTWAIALVELGIATGIVMGAFLLAFGALALAFALAVGLGSRRAVELMWEERFRQRDAARRADPEQPKSD